MEKNIIALLNKNLRVIIPDFGAFIIRQKQPKIIVFNEFLRYNDGLLIDFIVKTEGIDMEIAEQRVAGYAEESTRLLDSGRELILHGLGSLHKDSSGKISFTEEGEKEEIREIVLEEPVKSMTPDSPEVPEKTEPAVPVMGAKAKRSPKKPGKVTRSAVEVKKKTVKTGRPSRAKKDSSPVLQAEPTQSEEPVAPVLPVEPPQAEKPVAPVLPVAPPPAVEPAAPVLPVEPPQVEKPVAPVLPVEPFITQTTGIRRVFTANRTNQVLAWILVVLFANAAILAWFVFGDEIRGFFGKKPVPELTLIDSVYQQLEDSVKAAATDTSLVYMENTGAPALVPSDVHLQGSRYYIVAGCFRDEVNAETLVRSLKGLGYKAEQFGKIGNLYAVCYASFDEKDNAVQELKRIREKAPDAWMTRF